MGGVVEPNNGQVVVSKGSKDSSSPLILSDDSGCA